MRRLTVFMAVLTACSCALAVPTGRPSKTKPAPSTATLAILETTDLHTHIIGYDYFRLAEDPSFGLDRTATLIRQARREFANTLLVDAGDTIEGTALADFQAQQQQPSCDTPIAMFKAMNALGYDAATVGNHEFNYGLNWLGRAAGIRLQAPLSGSRLKKPCAGPAFPLILANVIGKQSQKTIFPPYVILTRNIKAVDENGQSVQRRLRIGLIGFTPPQIMMWDKRWLDGKLATVGMVEAAKRYVPQMRKAGADIVVVVSHGGLDASSYRTDMENANYYVLRDVPGIDALLMGHSHQVFPDAASKSAGFNAPGVDKVKGLVHGIPAVMAGFWGKYLGVISLELAHDGKRWQVNRDATRVEARPTRLANGQYVAPDASIRQLVATEHQQAQDYARTPIGKTDFAMSTYFADVGDVTAIQTVNMAQTEFVRQELLANRPDLTSVPVLSVSAPFKSGFASARDYTDIKPGPLAINHAADLYLYPNTLQAVQVNGAGLKAWLESSAKRFNRIDPHKSEPQELIASFPGYNFDMLTSPDISYQIDLSQAIGDRIRNLTYKNKPIDVNQPFIVATNNYRASGGGGFVGMNEAATVLTSTQTNRDIVIKYVRANRGLTREAHGSAKSWSFTPLITAGPVVFHAPSGMTQTARLAGIDNVVEIKEDDGLGKGFALYELQLSR